MCALVCAAAIGLAAATPLYPNPRFLAAGPIAAHAAGDFNRDGRLDLAGIVPSRGEGVLFPGRGDGSFDHPVVGFPVDASAFLLISGDFNGDHLTDLATNGAVLLGAGDGTFSATPVPAIAAAHRMLADDVNADGRDDLVVSLEDATRSTAILLGRADGSFEAPRDIGHVSAEPSGIVTGDFDGDGRRDLAVSGTAGTPFSVTLYMGLGDGTFTPGARLEGPYRVSRLATGDTDGDGRDELLAQGLGEVVLVLYRLTGTGTLASVQRLPALGSPTAGDFDRDGREDFVVVGIDFEVDTVSSSPGNMTTFLGSSGGGLIRGATLLTTLGPGVAGDFDGDGRLDLAVGGAGGASVYGPHTVYLGRGDGSFITALPLGVGWTDGLVAADFNGDGREDLAAAFGGDSEFGVPPDLAIFMGIDGGLGPRRWPGSSAVFGLAGGDFDGDGHEDLVGAFPALGGLSSDIGVHFGLGDGTFAFPVRVSVGLTPGLFAIADFNGDGRDDLAVLNYDSKNISVLLSLGDRTFAPQVLYTSGERPMGMAAADVNGDGFVDLVVGNAGVSFVPGTGDVSVLLGRGDGTFAPRVIVAYGFEARSVAVGDADGDLHPDIVVARGEGDLGILYGIGGTSFEPFSFLGATPGPPILRDLDGDGRMDIAAAWNGTAVWLGRGARSFERSDFVFSGILQAGDFNGDGRTDLAAGQYDTYVAYQLQAEVDSDADGISNSFDNCPQAYNPDQFDYDGDGIGDVCDDCPRTSNPDQSDNDGDGAGDVCDNCLQAFNPDQSDGDFDGFGDVCDDCPTFPDPDQAGICLCEPGPIALLYNSPAGKGSAVVQWSTCAEIDLIGFNVVTLTGRGQQVERTQLNDALIPCESCVTGQGKSYAYLLPKHKSGKDIFIEMLRENGVVRTYGPATRP